MGCEGPGDVGVRFDRLNGLGSEIVEEGRRVKGWGWGAEAEVTSGFVSTGSTNLWMGRSEGIATGVGASCMAFPSVAVFLVDHAPDYVRGNARLE